MKIVRAILGFEKTHRGMVRPVGVTVDTSGIIYVADPGVRAVHVFNSAKKKYSQLTQSDVGQLKSPVGLATSPDGTLYVADAAKAEIVAYKNERVRFVIRGYFSRPTGLSYYNDRLYVVDTGNHKILVFDHDGLFLYEYGSRGTDPGYFNFPVFIDAGKQIYVSDALNFRVQVLTEDLEMLNTFGENGDAQGTFSRPKGIAVDSDGHIYIVDALFDAFQIFDEDGQLLLVIGESGHLPGQFNMPAGMFIDQQDRIYVVDTLNRRLQIFQYLKADG